MSDDANQDVVGRTVAELAETNADLLRRLAEVLTEALGVVTDCGDPVGLEEHSAWLDDVRQMTSRLHGMSNEIHAFSARCVAKRDSFRTDDETNNYTGDDPWTP